MRKSLTVAGLTLLLGVLPSMATAQDAADGRSRSRR